MSIYIWIIFCILPFFFIFRASTRLEIGIGIALVLSFFLFHFFATHAKPGLVYMWISFEMVVHLLLTLLYGYVYLAIFIAFFIGNIRHPVGFYIMYGLHLGFTIIAVVAGFFIDLELFLPQIPYIIITIIGAILLPFNLYNRNKQENLEGQLEDAKETISALHIIAERERIARDLHDTLGQKLSLIGLKSDLAYRLVTKDAQKAQMEIKDIRETARIALKEVRELVAGMRAITLNEELPRIRQILTAAEMECVIEGDTVIKKLPAIVENVLSMCLKEAVNNVVKHSKATKCTITFIQEPNELVAIVEDDGIGLPSSINRGTGLKGMRERLNFINGTLHIAAEEGTQLTITVPNVITHQVEEEIE
ncbi:sensor histidine kinase [Savagea faecisuis]|uniref:histidine kinase n=1 Tax=Savagea faecisuis TaxID=1274803 RepID=A0ABW3GTB3_9BACL